MILVAVGASHIPFDRLMGALDGADFAEPLVVQHGPSKVRPPNAELVEFLPVQELAALVREASAVITHAGVGSIILCLTNGKRPYVVPRMAADGGAVDDHQFESARRFAAAGLVTVVEDPAGLPAALAAPQAALALDQGEPRLIAELRSYVTEAIG